MRLVRFGEARTGILLELPAGPHVLDVVASVGALSPGDPISNGILNGILKDGGSWGPLIQHWDSARVGLGKLVQIAFSNPGHPGLVLHRCAEVDAMSKSTKGGGIVALGIAEDHSNFSYCPESSRDCEIASCIYSARGGYRG
jgi:hypothetical protein